jgi:hypothetical protein
MFATTEPEPSVAPIVDDRPPELVPRERFLSSQRTIGLLLAEREKLVELVRSLAAVVARNYPSPINLAGELNAMAVYRQAAAILTAWDASRSPPPSAETIGSNS